MVSQAKKNSNLLDASEEALLFSIYYASITSLSADDVSKNLGQNKEALMKRYRFAVERALMGSKFLETQELVTLQAFVLFLVCVRCNGESRTWSGH